MTGFRDIKSSNGAQRVRRVDLRIPRRCLLLYPTQGVSSRSRQCKVAFLLRRATDPNIPPSTLAGSSRSRGPTQDDAWHRSRSRLLAVTKNSPTRGASVTSYENFTVPLVMLYLDKPAFDSHAAANLATVRFVYAVMVDRAPWFFPANDPFTEAVPPVLGMVNPS